MQGRMKQHQLTNEQITSLLNREIVGRIATNDPNGFPYIVPVHFVYLNHKIYIHGLIKGQKIDYMRQNPKIGFEVDHMGEIILDQTVVCDTNTEFKSVIILGNAAMVEDAALKNRVLKLVVEKYTPTLSHLEFPANMLKATGVIEITPTEITGKYFK